VETYRSNDLAVTMSRVVVKSTGTGKKHVKDYSKGTIAKNKHDIASKRVHEKYGTTGTKRDYGVKKKDRG